MVLTRRPGWNKEMKSRCVDRRMIPPEPSRFQRSRSSKRRHRLRDGICPSNRRSRCRFSAVLVTLSAMLAACLLLPLATVFVHIDHDSKGQAFLIKGSAGVVDEESRSIASGLDSQVRVENMYGSGVAGNGSGSDLGGAGSDLGSVVVERENPVGEFGKLRNGWDRCFVDDDGYHRCYPTVFFFGTSKCATTSLARWLDEHPATHWVANPRRPHQIEETGVKEAHVFDDPPKGNGNQEQILLHQKLFITSPKVSRDDVVIDYTPHYLASSEAAHRIFDMYGKGSGLKFIVTLREPASRAISSWEFKNEYNPKKGRREETRTLRKTVDDGIKRGTKLLACVKQAKKKKLSNRERDLLHCNPRKFLERPLYVSHVGKSMYAVQLERWFNLFGRENVKVVFMDDMATDPMGVLEDVLDFLELDFTDEDESKGLPDWNRWKKITGMSYNKTKSKKKDELANQVTDELKAELRRFFEPQNRELEKLLGCPVPSSWNQ